MKIRLPVKVAERMQRRREDFEIQTFRCGGKGGQNVNKVNSGVRIKDKITGLSAEGRESRSQDQNRKSAFRKLVDRLIALAQHETSIPVVGGASDERTIRTYSFTRNEVVDHRTKGHYNLSRTLNGELGPIHEELARSERISS